MILLNYIAVSIFVIGYLLRTLEHKISTHKSGIALAMAGILWVLVALSGHHDLTHAIEASGAEVFEIVIFLLSTMTLVEILVHYNFFDIIRLKLLKMNLDDRAQFYIIGILTFFLSAILDNLTITIIMIQIAKRFFRNENLLKAAAGIVILANAGGAWSPMGDVTTIMLWLADKFTATQVITEGIIPSICLGIVSGYLIGRQIKTDTKDIKEEQSIRFTRGEKAVIALALGSFSLPLMMNLIGLRPYFGLLLGLGLVWMLIEYIKAKSRKITHLEANIEHLLQKADISSLNFFIGILLSVSALSTLGILEKLSQFVFGSSPSFNRIFTGNMAIGLLSSIVDNVPLTALAIDALHITSPELWVLTAIAVGTGGSFLVIGSAAGVVAMGMTKGLTFNKYLRTASIPALIGYITALFVWLIQYQIFIK